ncbi:MAG TPA: histidinol dehydrogenase [Acidimicrobiales bacterium]
MLRRLDLRGKTGDLRAHLPAPEAGGEGPVAAVAEIVAAVRERGDDAVRDLTLRFDGVRIEELLVPAHELKDALESLDPTLRAALEVAVDRVGDFHRHQLAETAHPATYERDGVTVRTEFRAVERAACYVPGGRAVYPSTVVHTAVPARIAGVDEVVLCVPPDDTGHVPAVTLAAAALAGVDEVYRIGGAQAIAAVAYGTASIRPVDVIVGPGNIYVALAKRAVADVCGVPTAFAGPSEVVVVADATAPVELVAVDVLVQAEHGPLGLAWLVCWDEAVADAVTAEVARQVAVAPRRAEIEATLASSGYAVLCDSPEQAMAVSNAVAPEHLELITADPEALVPLVRHAGAVFCGPATPASLGDYLAGPSHVLPTHRSARFGQALTVRDFLKEVHVVTATPAGMAALAPHLEALASAEGLLAHAESATRRR